MELPQRLVPGLPGALPAVLLTKWQVEPVPRLLLETKAGQKLERAAGLRTRQLVM